EGHRRDAEAGFTDAERQRKAADEARDQEAGQRRQAEAHLYLSRIAQARLEWEVHRLGEMRLSLDRCRPGPGEADPRGWEWHYLRGLAHADLLTLPAVYEVVNGVAFSPDGRRLIVGGGDPYDPQGQGLP